MMLHSDCSLFGGAWDTNRANLFLKISDKEMRLLNSVPGWSKEQTSEDQIPVHETNALPAEKHPNPLQSSVQVNTDNHSPILNPDLNKTKNITSHDSHSLLKSTRFAPSTDKDNFMHSISLCFNRVVGAFLKSPRKRSNSVSDIHSFKASESLPSSKSETNLLEISRNVSAEQFTPDKYSAENMEHSGLISIPLEDKTNRIQTIAEIHAPMDSGSPLKKKTVEKLGADILSHPYLKEALPTEDKFEDSNLPSFIEKKDTTREQLKKLDLLQKRFSQSETCNLLPSNEGSKKEDFDLESFCGKKGSIVVSESTKEAFESQTKVNSTNSVNDKEVNSGADLNSSENTKSIEIAGHVGGQGPQNTLDKPSESHSVAIPAEDYPDNKSCTSQQGKLIPVVIHLPNSDTIPQSSNEHSSTQQSEINSRDAESYRSVSCVTPLSPDTHSVVRSHSTKQPTTVDKDIDACLPVPCGLFSSSHVRLPDQPSLRNQPETLPTIKFKDNGICGSVSGGILPSSGHSSIQSILKDPKLVDMDTYDPVSHEILEKSNQTISKDLENSSSRDNEELVKFKSSPIKISSSSQYNAALSNGKSSKFISPMKSKDVNIRRIVPSDILPSAAQLSTYSIPKHPKLLVDLFDPVTYTDPEITSSVDSKELVQSRSSPSGISSSSSQYNATLPNCMNSNMISPMKSTAANLIESVLISILPPPGAQLSVQSISKDTAVRSSTINGEALHCTSSPSRMSSSSQCNAALPNCMNSNMISPMKSKAVNISESVLGDILPPPVGQLSVQSISKDPEVRSSTSNGKALHCTTSLIRISSSESPAHPDSAISLIYEAIEKSLIAENEQRGLRCSAMPSPMDLPSLGSSKVAVQTGTEAIKQSLEVADERRGLRCSAMPSPMDLPSLGSSKVAVQTGTEAKAGPSTKADTVESEGASFSVFSDKPSGWVVERSSTSGEAAKVSGKRKRPTKDDHKSRKRASLSNSQRDVKYTAEQIKIMIEIMRFQYNARMRF